MTVQELIDYLEKMPKDAFVMLRHDLVGNEHEAVVVEYNEKRTQQRFGRLINLVK